MGWEALPGWHRYRSPANWKLMAENFIGDNYHFAHTHTSWIRVMREFNEQGIDTPMTTSPLRWHEPTYELTAGYRRGCPLGLGSVRLHTDALYERDLGHAAELAPDVVEWVKDRNDAMGKALAGYVPRPYGFGHGLIYPNLGLMGYMSPFIGKHFLLFHPRGPEAHETWQWTMVEKQAPQSAKDIAVQRTYQGQHMAGVIAPTTSRTSSGWSNVSHSPADLAPALQLRDPPRPRGRPAAGGARQPRSRAERGEPAGVLPLLARDDVHRLNAWGCDRCRRQPLHAGAARTGGQPGRADPLPGRAGAEAY